MEPEPGSWDVAQCDSLMLAHSLFYDRELQGPTCFFAVKPVGRSRRRLHRAGVMITGLHRTADSTIAFTGLVHVWGHRRCAPRQIDGHIHLPRLTGQCFIRGPISKLPSG